MICDQPRSPSTSVREITSPKAIRINAAVHAASDVMACWAENRAMVDILERKGKPLNENYTIAAALAARLGLDRIVEVDDHTADTAFDEKSPAGQAYAKAIQAAWIEERG